MTGGKAVSADPLRLGRGFPLLGQIDISHLWWWPAGPVCLSMVSSGPTGLLSGIYNSSDILVPTMSPRPGARGCDGPVWFMEPGWSRGGLVIHALWFSTLLLSHV